MKIRAGFVSNSSSSSFILAFEKQPKDMMDLKKILLGEDEIYCGPYNGNCFSASTVAETVWTDMNKNGPAGLDAVAEEFNSGYLPDLDVIERPHCGLEDSDEVWRTKHDDYYDKRAKMARNIAEKFMEEHKDYVFFVVEYEDHDPLGGAIEHGDLFENIEYVRISKH